MADYDLTFNTVSIPTNSGGVTVTVEEDDNSDGTVDTTEQVTLSDGVTSYTTSSGAFAGSGQVRLSWSIGPPSDVTTTGATVVPADVTVVINAPDAPSNLSVTQGNEDELDLSWTDNADNEDGFRVYRAQSTGSTTGDYTQVADLAANTTSYTDTGLSDGTEYYYRVSAYNSAGESSLSNEDSGVTVLPAATGLTSTDILASEVGLSWMVQSDTGTQSIEYRLSGASSWTTDSSGLGLGTLTGEVDGLQFRTEYEFRVGVVTSDAGPVYSGTLTVTTVVPTTRVTSTGWSVAIGHPESGRVIRPDVINPNQVQYLPGPNMMPRIRLPVRRAPSWLESEFDNNPNMAVHLDGTELPVGELVDVELEEGQTILIGEGGAELRTVVDVEYDAERRPVAATNLVDANTTYTTVDNSPAPESQSNLVQDPSGETELGDLITLSDTDPFIFTSGGIKPAQTCFTTEGENQDNASGASLQEDTAYSSGSARGIQSNGDFVEYDFTLDYAIPSGEFTVLERYETTGNTEVTYTLDPNGADITLGTNQVSTALAHEDLADTLGDWSDPGQVSAGSHTLRVEVTDSDSSFHIVDVIAPADGRYSYTLDNSVHQNDGYLDGPQTHPTVDAEFDAYESAFSIVGGSASVTINDTTGDQALALSNDRGSTYPVTSSNSASVSGSFASPGATLTLKATLSRYSPSGPRDQTPREGYDAQRLDAYELTADLEFESLLVNDEYGDSLDSVLTDILTPRYAWRVSVENGTTTVTVDEPGNSVASRDPEISESQITKKVVTYDTVRIKGSSLSVSGETFQASTSFVSLNEDDIVPGSEAVYDDTGTNYQEGIDFTLNYGAGEIKALAGGDLDTSKSYSVDYRHQVESTHTVSGATGDTLVRTIPGVTSDRQAEQIAYVLAEVYPAVSTPRYEGEIVVPRLDAGFDPLEGLQLSEMDLPDVARPLSIRGEPELTPLGLTLRLGSAPSLEESLRAISQQVSAVSDRV